MLALFRFLIVLICDFQVTVEVNYSCLEIAEAYPEDSAQYTVVIKNAAGEARTQCRITIESFYSSTGSVGFKTFIDFCSF